MDATFRCHFILTYVFRVYFDDHQFLKLDSWWLVSLFRQVPTLSWQSRPRASADHSKRNKAFLYHTFGARFRQSSPPHSIVHVPLRQSGSGQAIIHW